MEKELFGKVVEKYISHYYHEKTIYERIPVDKNKWSLFNCDHIEIVYDLYNSNITESDVDFVFDKEISYDKNKIKLMDYIFKLEKEDNNIEKSLIHLGWYFIVRNNSITKMLIEKNKLNEVHSEPMKTLVEFNIKVYKADQYFRRTCDFFDGMIKAINNDYKKQKEIQDKKENDEKKVKMIEKEKEMIKKRKERKEKQERKLLKIEERRKQKTKQIKIR